jgi:hypothetical protein
MNDDKRDAVEKRLTGLAQATKQTTGHCVIPAAKLHFEAAVTKLSASGELYMLLAECIERGWEELKVAYELQETHNKEQGPTKAKARCKKDRKKQKPKK